MNKNLHQDETEESLKEAETTDNLCVGEHIDLIEDMFTTFHSFDRRKKKKQFEEHVLRLNAEILSLSRKTRFPLYEPINLEQDEQNSVEKKSTKKTIRKEQGKKEEG